MAEEAITLPFESPVFPLNIVVFPGETVPLHIFEDRYKALVQHCLQDQNPPAITQFGIMHYENGEMARVGSLVRITEIFHTYKDGRLDMLTIGEDRFEILGEIYEDEYPRGQIRIINDDEASEPDAGAVEQIKELYGEVITTFKLDPKNEPCPLGTPISFQLARNTVVRVEDRQRLLEARTENERLGILTGIYKELVGTVAEREEMKRIIQLNGHFGMVEPTT